jgi:hypothetical protein
MSGGSDPLVPPSGHGGSVSSGGTSGGNESHDCSAGYVVDPRSRECVPSKGATLNSVDGWEVIGDIAAAGNDNEGAVAYVEGKFEGDGGEARVVVQRLDATGTFFGEPLRLASAPVNELNSVAIASNGEDYLVCWASAGKVSCSALRAGLEPVAVFREEGRAIAAVHGEQGWLIAYTTDPLLQPAKIVLRRFAENLDAQSAGPSFTVASEISSQVAMPLLASTDSGFLLVADAPELENRAQLIRLNPELEQQGAAVDLGHRFWMSGCLAASASLAAVSLAEPYGSNLILVDESGLVQSLNIPGGGKTGMHEALVNRDSQVVASWFSLAPALHTQVFSSGNEALLLPAGTPGGPLGNSTSTPSKLVLVRVSGRTIAVYTLRFGVPAVMDDWRAEGVATHLLPAD